MFVNITHPAQLRDQKIQRQVKKFTSRHNFQRHELDQLRRLEICRGAQGLIEEAETSASEEGDASRKALEPQLSNVLQPNSTPTQEEVEGLNADDSLEEAGAFEDLPGRDIIDIEEDKLQIDDVLSEHGGLRVPHVDTYPPHYVSTHLRGLLNYYVQVFGPDDVWKPVLTTERGSRLIKSYHIQLSITQPVLLEALFAICQARRDRKVLPDGAPSMIVLLHRGKVLEMMQERLASDDTAVDDITLFAVSGLISLDLMFQNWRSLRSNLKGFRRIATMRGGVDKLGWEGLFKSYLGWAELSWAAHVAELAAKNKRRKLPEYPSHPFLPSLSVMISKLPNSIAEQALDLELSVQVISFLEQVTGLIKARKEPGAAARSGELYLKRVQLTTRVNLILGTLQLKQEERLFCIGAMAYIIFVDGPIVVYKYPTGVEDHIVAIPTWVARIEPSECMLWIAVVIAASIEGEMTPRDRQWFLLDLVLANEEMSQSWESVRTILHKFYWDASMEVRSKKCWNTAMKRKKARKESVSSRLQFKEGPGMN